jgi:deoxyribose-phosphate aldolase
MPIKRADEAFHESGKTDALRSWLMVFLTLTLVLLYAAALLGWFKPLADEKMAVRLEPIIFVIVGFCFGRLPSQQNERALKEQISRHAQKVDATQHAKEQALQTLAALEEKVKNVTSAVAPVAARKQLNDDKLNGSLAAALEILNS